MGPILVLPSGDCSSYCVGDEVKTMGRGIPAAVCVVLCCLTTNSSPRLSAATPTDPITEWSQAATRAAAAVGMQGLRTPITLAILHLAMFDAVSAITGNPQPHAAGQAARGASPYAAAVEAGYRVLIAEFASLQPTLQITYTSLLAAEVDSASKRAGVEIGAGAAHRLLAWRANDGRNDVIGYVPGSKAGDWVPTPPGLLPVTTAFLAKVTPFTMESPSQFRPSGPPQMGSRTWLADYNEVKTLGVKDDSTRTANQTATALFWEPLAGTVWIPTIHRLAREQQLDLESSARFQAAAFAAFADGIIACWDAKFHFNFWRPVTAIRRGDADTHPQTAADPEWEPLAVTPNFPEYPSGHACASAAAAHTIEDFFQHEVPIPARNVASGEERVYRRAAQLVDEVVEARMLLGVHFRAGDEDGAEIGRQIARQIKREGFRAKKRDP
jgi:PAP2 superfamily